MSIHIDEKEIYHVHSYRCGHAENVPDEAYVKKAIELGATGIFFTDHTPLPGDKIPYRMKMEQLPEYLETIHSLKEKYAGIINVRVGLEIEYMPSFIDFYKALREDPRVEIMMIGQHAYEAGPGEYRFMRDDDYTGEPVYAGFADAMIRGAESGLFDIFAHPDRIYTEQGEWCKDMENISREIIDAAVSAGMKLEKNMESVRRKVSYRREFWELVPEKAEIVLGADSHFTEDLAEKWKMQQEYYAGGMRSF